MEKRNILKNEKGFTLIEIIAVLILLGILAAVAVPKYMDLTEEAKLKAAEGQVAEMKGTLSLAWGKQMLAGNAAAVTIADILTQIDEATTVAFDVGTTPDIWNVTLTTSTSGTALGIAVNSRDSDTDYNATGTWNLPQ